MLLLMLFQKTGIPFRAVARMQCNLRVNNLAGFYAPEYQRFSDTVLPIGWIEYVRTSYTFRYYLSIQLLFCR